MSDGGDDAAPRGQGITPAARREGSAAAERGGGIAPGERGEQTAPAARGEQTAPAARGERIAKWLARAGIASRRDAERMIAEARVRVDNRVVATPATFIRPGDLVTVDGKAVADPQRTRLFRYHKPDGLLTTHRDPEGRPTVFERLPAALPRLVSVGRLDYGSEGLLLLTNDGALARRLELPANGWIRRYRVRVHGAVNERELAALARGVTVEGVRYGPIEAGLDSRQGANAWLTVALQEGKNREVRRVMAHLGLQVTRLIRTAYGPFQLGNLPRGAVEEVNPKVLREQLGAGAAPAPPRPSRAAPAAAPPPVPARGPRRPPRARNAGDPPGRARDEGGDPGRGRTAGEPPGRTRKAAEPPGRARATGEPAGRARTAGEPAGRTRTAGEPPGRSRTPREPPNRPRTPGDPPGRPRTPGGPPPGDPPRRPPRRGATRPPRA